MKSRFSLLAALLLLVVVVAVALFNQSPNADPYSADGTPNDKNAGRSVTSRLPDGNPAPGPASVRPAGSRTLGPAVTTGEEPVPAIDEFADWLGKHRDALARHRVQPVAPDVLRTGAALAVARRPVMRDLMRRDPQQALERSVPWSDWTVLPDEVQKLVERPFSEHADYEVFSDCRPKGERGTPVHTRFLTLADGTYKAFVYGRRETVLSKEGTPLQGILLDDLAALWESPVFDLDERDLAAVRTLLADGNPRDRSWLTGELVGEDTHAALSGGQIYHFNSGDESRRVAASIAAAEDLIGPHTVVAGGSPGGPGAPPVFDPDEQIGAGQDASSQWTETNKTLLVIRVVYQGQSTASHPASNNLNLFTNISAASIAIDSMSYGKTQLIPTYPQIFILPGTKTSYEVANNGNPVNGPIAGHSKMRADAAALATNAGFNPSNFDFVCYWTPPTSNTISGFPMTNNAFASLGSGDSTFNGNFGTRTSSLATHEFGHNYGLGHANAWTPGTGGFVRHDPAWFDATRSGYDRQQGPEFSIQHVEYGNIFDIMGPDWETRQGGNPVFFNGHFSMNSKAHLEWIESDEVWNATSSGNYRIYRFDHKDARNMPGRRLALKAKVGGRELWVGFRRNFANHPSISTSAFLVWADTKNRHRLIDTTPLSVSGFDPSSDREDAGLAVGASYTDPSGKVRITNLGWGGSSPSEYMDLRVTFLEEPKFELFTDTTRSSRGLAGSYVNGSVSDLIPQGDWRTLPIVTVAGTRVDPDLHFPENDWGFRAPLNLTGGSDDDWDDYSVQWDGILVVHEETSLSPVADRRSRMWIDLDGNGSFGSSAPEYLENNWGQDPVGRTGLIPPGEYAIRIQFRVESGNNSFTLLGGGVHFELFADAACQTRGLEGSYVSSSLWFVSSQSDWRSSQTIAGTRTDLYPGFLQKGELLSNWGSAASVGLSAWSNFSVQWDGWIKVYEHTNLRTISSDGSRMWIDLNGSGGFASGSPEFVNNQWGTGDFFTGLGLSVGPTQAVPPGKYRIRIQHEKRLGSDNAFLLFGTPIASDWWVDFNNSGPFKFGTFVFPYDNLPTPLSIASENTTLWIKAGTTPGSITIDEPVRLEAVGGEVRIGN